MAGMVLLLHKAIDSLPVHVSSGTAQCRLFATPKILSLDLFNGYFCRLNSFGLDCHKLYFSLDSQSKDNEDNFDDVIHLYICTIYFRLLSRLSCCLLFNIAA